MTTDSNTTDLVRDNSADSVAATIPTLTNTGNPCTTSYNNSTFTTNSWGYRINNNVGGETNCIDTTNTNYYSYTPGTLISSATTATNEQTATLTFASKIDYLKPAGQYALTLKMSALPIVTTYYMQDIAASPTLASSVCTEEPTVVLDKRDEQAYTIRRINGTCWMVENLQFTGSSSDTDGIMTLDSTTSNVAAQYTPSNPLTLTYHNMYTESAAASGDCHFVNANAQSWITPCLYEADVSSPGSPIDSTASGTVPAVWYNYAALSAGTITGYDNTEPQLYDVCPAGWKLPTSTEINNVIGYIADFNPSAGGYMPGDGTILYPERGFWWGSTSGTNTKSRYVIGYISGALSIITTGNRGTGAYARCVLKGTNIDNLTYMQDFATLNQSGNIAKKTQVINSMSEDQSYQLKDIRENGANSYYVAKLKDDNVWMVQNLKLGNASASLSLTTADSDVPSAGFTLNGKLSDGKFTYTTVSGADYQNNSSQYYCTTNYGCYYNWYTATGSSGTTSVSTDGANANYSVCPKGWTLPAQTQFATLNTLYGSSATDLLVNPTNLTENTNGTSMPGFLLGGYYNSNGPNGVGSVGVYWSRTANSAEHGYGPSITTSSTNPTNTNWKYGGRSVRCLAY